MNQQLAGFSMYTCKHYLIFFNVCGRYLPKATPQLIEPPEKAVEGSWES